MLELLLNAVMKIVRSHALGAAPYEQIEERQTYANGLKDKAPNTRMGRIELKVPFAFSKSIPTLSDEANQASSH